MQIWLFVFPEAVVQIQTTFSFFFFRADPAVCLTFSEDLKKFYPVYLLLPFLLTYVSVQYIVPLHSPFLTRPRSVVWNWRNICNHRNRKSCAFNTAERRIPARTRSFNKNFPISKPPGLRFFCHCF